MLTSSWAYGEAQRDFFVTKRYLHLPVKNGAPMRSVALWVNGTNARQFKIELADSAPDWWAFTDMEQFRGAHVTVRIDGVASNSPVLAQLEAGDEIKTSVPIYQEELRPQFHFSARRGWLNDPNGLVFYHGTYHLFFQHNPYGWNSENMQWGHATSTDLLHWTEHAEAIYNDTVGPIWSGSAAVDWRNTSGLGVEGKPPLVALYTSAGNSFSQCLAYSTNDGQTFVKYTINPVVPEIAHENRDPKVFWHEASHHWVMVLWVEDHGKKTIRILTSPNLKNWSGTNAVDGFFECPDLFPLAVDGDPNKLQWILTAADSDYEIGDFDGSKFAASTPKLPGVRSPDFYAAQTYGDIPATDGRRIQIGWLRAASPGMPFNQCMSLPLELKLVSTLEGLRLTRFPVKEIDQLRYAGNDFSNFTITPGSMDPLSIFTGQQLEIETEFTPQKSAVVEFNLRGSIIRYDASAQELFINGRSVPATLRHGTIRLRMFVDSTVTEVFAQEGLIYAPVAFIPKPREQGANLTVLGGSAKINSLSIYRLKSIWNR